MKSNRRIFKMNEITNKNNLTEGVVSPALLYTKELSDRTRMSYKGDIRMFFGVDDLKDITIEMLQSVTTEQINQWSSDLVLKKKYARSTVNQKLAALFGFYKFLCRRNIRIMTYNPFSIDEGCHRFKYTTKNYTERMPMNDEQVQILIDSLDVKKNKHKNKFAAYRDKAMIELMLTTGIRRDEIRKIKIGDISRRSGKDIIFITGKGGKSRVVVVAEKVMEDIKKYLSKRELSTVDHDEYLFSPHSNRTGLNPKGKNLSLTSIDDITDKCVGFAGLSVDDISPHVFRHTFCTDSLRAGARLEDVQDMMGHSNINTTRRYDHIDRVVENSTSDMLGDKFIK